jgi:predicted dienelactone hydrolase
VRHVNDPDTKGELTGGMMIKIYYPAKLGSKGSRLSYTSTHVSSALAQYINMPQFMFGHLPLAWTNAMQRVPLAASDGQKFPVVVWSHGLGGHADVYTTVAEELAR